MIMRVVVVVVSDRGGNKRRVVVVVDGAAQPIPFLFPSFLLPFFETPTRRQQQHNEPIAGYLGANECEHRRALHTTRLVVRPMGGRAVVNSATNQNAAGASDWKNVSARL